ncbi:hypothetical protein I317_01943 [Kwoniella heveanensis CBS 569]|nr:hypothetical protein I317_01943 [Kwoniella heveanensis CBS 569]
MTASPALSHKSEMMFLGKECHHPSCHLHDFLPFSCPACHLSFCQPHFLPSQHQCTEPLPSSMVDRIAPKCPMCDEIVPYPKSMDPNEAVEKHILSGTCTGFEGGEERKKAEIKRKRDNGEICWKKTCGKKLVVKMKCEQCQHLFCPTHRHFTSHTCDPSTSASASASSSSSRTATPLPPPVTKPAGKAALSRLIPQSMQPPKATPTASSSSTAAANPAQQQPPIKAAAPVAVKAAFAGPSNTNTNTNTNLSSSSTGATEPKPLDARAAAAAAALKRAGQDVKVPFVKTKTEKRSQAELNSTIQALKARHDKGLLSKTEEVR